MSTTTGLIVHSLTGVGVLLSVLGLAGPYARQAEQSGVLGLISFILASIRSALTAGALFFVESIMLPFATLPNA